jgi:hypothetical protein
MQEKAIYDGRSRYEAGGLKKTFHGNIYQLRLLMLFMIRALKNKYEFELLTEMTEAEKFDDLVIKYKAPGQNGYSYCYLQAKHSQKLPGEPDYLIKKGELKGKKGDFSLLKYFNSFQKIINSHSSPNDTHQFVLCTNKNIDNSIGQITARCRNPGHLAMFMAEGKESFITLKPQDTWELISSDSRRPIEFATFCNSFIFAVNQPNEEELTRIISGELASYFNLKNIEAIYGMLEKASIDWLVKTFKEIERHPKRKITTYGTTVTTVTAAKFMSWMKTEINVLQLDSTAYKHELKELGINFKKSEELEEHFKDPETLYYLIDGSVELGAIRFINTMEAIGYDKEDSYAILTVGHALAYKEKLSSCLKKNFPVAVVCDDPRKTRKLMCIS